MKTSCRNVDAVKRYCGVPLARVSDAMRLGVSGQESYVTTWTTSATSEGGETSPSRRHVFSFRRASLTIPRMHVSKSGSVGQWRTPNAPHSLIKDRSRYDEADNGAAIAAKNSASFYATRHSYRCTQLWQMRVEGRLNLIDSRYYSIYFAQKQRFVY